MHRISLQPDEDSVDAAIADDERILLSSHAADDEFAFGESNRSRSEHDSHDGSAKAVVAVARAQASDSMELTVF